MSRAPKHRRHELVRDDDDPRVARCIHCGVAWASLDDEPIATLDLRDYEGGYRVCWARDRQAAAKELAGR